MTPFARPVVPPVYMSAPRSSSERGTSGCGSVATSSAYGTVLPAAAGTSPATTTCRTSGAAAAAAVIRDSSSGEVTTATAPESTSTCRSSASLSRNTTGVTTAPARQIAPYATSTSGPLAMQTTTRSPGRTPSPTRPPVSRRTASSRSGAAMRRPS